MFHFYYFIILKKFKNLNDKYEKIINYFFNIIKHE